MNKLKIDNLIVVEGKTDIDFLSSFIDGKFYSVNGSSISIDDFNYLKEVNKKNKIIVLTDPDYPGLSIRNKINEYLDNDVYNAYVRKEYSIKNHKVGVAESTKQEVINALSNLKLYKNNITSDLKNIDLFELGLSGQGSYELRKELCDTYNIGYSNSKQLLKKLKLLGINKTDLNEMVRNVNTKRDN